MSEPVTRPARLHHHASVVRDQAATRRFYEDVIGLPLVATWCEVEDFGEGPVEYCHTFYELGDGGALAFFQFADPVIAERLRLASAPSVFHHVALHVTPAQQEAVRARATAAGAASQLVDHGYCTSLYLYDPDGFVVELTADDPAALRDATAHRARAAAELARWLDGDRAANNTYRRD